MSVDLLWADLEERLLPIFADYRSRIADLSIEIKADRTLLTEADVRIQELIVAAIRAHEPGAVIIAEEDERIEPRAEVIESDGRIWIIDPIDGTAQFVRHDQVEFCSVVCLLESWQPARAFVLAPELGLAGTRLLITVDAVSRTVFVDGAKVYLSQRQSNSSWLSLTRSADEPTRPIDAIAAHSGYQAKTRTTSQTLDMVRTALDISAITSPSLPPFSLFWRRAQKVWDGVAGLCLASAAGLRICNEIGDPVLIGPQWLGQPCPIFDSTVVGRQEMVDWFISAGSGNVSAEH